MFFFIFFLHVEIGELKVKVKANLNNFAEKES